jgi:hypothetical protein
MATEINKTGDTDITDEEGALEAVRPMGRIEEEPQDSENVVYRGQATYRRISVEQWEQAGVMDQGEAIWNTANNFQRPVSWFNEAALEALRNDGSFSVPDTSGQ